MSNKGHNAFSECHLEKQTDLLINAKSFILNLYKNAIPRLFPRDFKKFDFSHNF